MELKRLKDMEEDKKQIENYPSSFTGFKLKLPDSLKTPW